MTSLKQTGSQTPIDSSRRKLALALFGGFAGSALLEACGADEGSVVTIEAPTDVERLAQSLAISVVAFETTLDLNSNAGPTSAFQIALVSGRSTSGDGGAAAFYWDPTSTQTANGGTVIGSFSAGRWKRISSGAVNVTWFGAKGDGTANDSDAIEAAIAVAAHLADAATADGGACVFFPAGIYRITRPVLSYRPTSTLRGPIDYRGEGRRTSVLLLDPPSSIETWFYDSNAAEAYYFNSFQDIGFGSKGANAGFVSGFRIRSTSGHEQGFSFSRCFFGVGGTLRRGFVFSGSTVTDKFVWTDCFFSNFDDTVITLNNLQCVCHLWQGCHFEDIRGDVFEVLDGTGQDGGDGGGGDFSVVGGSFVYGSASATRWLLNIQGSNNLDHMFNFFGIRTENRFGAGLVHKSGTLGRATVNFHGSQFARNIPSSAFEAVRIDCQCTVRFRDCHIPPQMTYRLTTTAAQEYLMSDPGSILFEGCGVPSDLSGRVSVDGVYGFARANGCRRNENGTAIALEAVDFDLNWTQMASMGRSVLTKSAVLKHWIVNWPRSSTGSGSSNQFETTTLLPVGAIIVGMTIVKPAYGSSQAAYRLHVGPSDKSTAWASSTQAMMKQEHTINVDLAPTDWIRVGGDMNLRNVRLWADPGGESMDVPQQPGEVALLRYL